MELSIVIPCYNENGRIGNTIEKILKYLLLKKKKTEIIFVNDGSTDETEIIIKNAIKKTDRNKIIYAKIVNYTTNRGKGYAIRQGIQKASGKYILLCDADLSTPITELDKLKKYISKYDLVIGSRKQKDSSVVKAQSPTRELLGKSYSFLSKIILGVNINDFTCGFKLLEKNKAKTIARKMTIARWGYDSEMLKIATFLKYKIKEVGVIWKNDEKTKVKLSHDIFSSFYDLIRIFTNSILRRYD
ncbi:hypothetical protein A3A46_00105 [Candidatus Roizmanbacteria bacterium RIFCSPLOWO2_01_FULL_37_13]|uniref:Glycosyltransferase 2-like domain-containing protein n=1 Tax=Candidatus Roizmanbacteria bacterium RIFCSPHIGHO2_02_FULL_38_11 TaxID=1802039 RepID=A0A1F7H395_9BACT|nr:MAG: hypothetical protein A3C25_04680 [Candidatus Roizmanbacteria bacterium RIFCSPHIGHO2_02_FULL_38_11]OGK32988.1 MAG: hypothetical protein A3F58_03970 [Candidatus Roizmanbacteria bacterium RIFCSPHIGHO2_12_FULL_37_9b]OGK42947.1 MAG: hypothetical protein A3A46_00105 [Candidatus Roizmanbacteria bacterium RIFCSPLOWO2_01_FULL_37_13]